jgi:hypothetical protein
VSCTDDRYREIQSHEVKRGGVKEQYQVTIRNKCAALENLEASEDINGARDNIRENIKFLPKRV